MTEQSHLVPSADYAAALVLLRQALGADASIDAPRIGRNGAEVNVRYAGAPPRRLHLAPWGLRIQQRQPAMVWIIPRATKALRSALRTRGEQFVDLSGAVRLTQPGLLVDREDLRSVRPTATTRQSADPFADKGSLVARVLLEHGDPARVWGVRELANTADVGLATASDVLRSLAERGLVSIVRHGRTAEIRLTDPRALIDAWTRAYDWRLNSGIALEAPMGDPALFMKRLPKLLQSALPKDSRWAFTLHAGASLVSPFATWERMYVYVDVRRLTRAEGLKPVISRLTWPPSPTGRFVLLVPHYTTSVWHGLRRVKRLPVVSDVQLILDLWHYPARGREQAEHLINLAFAPSRVHGG